MELEGRHGLVKREMDGGFPQLCTQEEASKQTNALRRRCLAGIEDLMQQLEALDALAVSGNRGRAARKKLVNRCLPAPNIDSS